jgi:glycosyltransferase involved in cell wall biosynthesis
MAEDSNHAQASELDRDSVTIVLPTKNEEQAVGSVIDEVRSCGYSKIVVVDGHSTDRTVQIARSKGVEFVLQHGRGKRDAVLTALRVARTKYSLLMDADMTYDAHDIDNLLSHMRGYDQVVGIRVPQPEAMSSLHVFGNRFLTRVYNLLFGTRLSDVLSGMYLLDTEFARTLQFELGELTVEQEILAQTTAIGRVGELPINYRRRLGKAKTHTWRQGIRDLLAMISIARRYSPVLLFGLTSILAIIPAAIVLLWVLLQSLRGDIFHVGYATLALFLFVIAAQGFTVSSLSLSMKLTLRQFERRLRRDAPFERD